MPRSPAAIPFTRSPKRVGCGSTRAATATAAAVALTGVVLAGAAFQLAPLVYFGAPALDGRVFLDQPVGYLVLAPIARVLDELSLLTEQQHLAVWSSIAAIGIASALARACRLDTATWSSRVRSFAHRIAVVVVGALVVCAVGVLVPRPMVALRAANPADVLVDFHSHTNRSHDGRWGFDAEANRAWHAAAGFNAAYISDHQTMEAWQRLADRGALADRAPSWQQAAALGANVASGPVAILPGIESAVPGAHINLLGVTAAHAPLFRDRRDLDTLGLAATPSAGRPLVLLTLPFDLARSTARAPRIDAIEISDGSPTGLGFARQHRQRILSLADSLAVPVVASSNNHGWGATAVAWTVLRIEGWQALTPAQLDEEIRAALARRPAPVRVIERSSLSLGDGRVAQMLALPKLLVHIWRIVGVRERVAFVGWIWAVWLLNRRSRRRCLFQVRPVRFRGARTAVAANPLPAGQQTLRSE